MSYLRKIKVIKVIFLESYFGKINIILWLSLIIIQGLN
jgi:hypothetical protein